MRDTIGFLDTPTVGLDNLRIAILLGLGSGFPALQKLEAYGLLLILEPWCRPRQQGQKQPGGARYVPVAHARASDIGFFRFLPTKNRTL